MATVLYNNERGYPPAQAEQPGQPAVDHRFYELFSRWIDYIDVKPESAYTYTRSIRPFIRWLQDQKITALGREHILAYRQFLEASKKPTTVQLYIIAVRQFFRWLEQTEVCKNVAGNVKGAKIDRSHKRDCLTSDQVKNVLGRIDRTNEQGLRDYALLSLMITGGLRPIEVCRANVEDIRTVGNSVRIYLQGKGKDERAEFVNLPRPVEAAIREYLHKRRHSSIALFTGTSPNSIGRMTTRSISRIVKARLQAAGYDSDRLTAHSLRHTAVTLALQGGQSLQDVQQFARHTAITTTMIYAHNIDRENNKCAEAIAAAVL